MCPASNVCVCVIFVCFFGLLLYVFVSLYVSGRYCTCYCPVCFQPILHVLLSCMFPADTVGASCSFMFLADTVYIVRLYASA